MEIALHALDLGAVPSTGGASTHLQLTASVETVMGLEGAPGGELEFAGAVPAATVQRLACAARVRRILLGPKSAVTDVGRARRIPGPAARAALRVRAGGCEWPGCDRPVAFTNAHHFVHWGHDGATEVPNLVLLCYPTTGWSTRVAGNWPGSSRDGCWRSRPRAAIVPGSARQGTLPPGRGRLSTLPVDGSAE